MLWNTENLHNVFEGEEELGDCQNYLLFQKMQLFHIKTRNNRTEAEDTRMCH